MTRWMRGWLLVAGLAAIVGVIGCSDWESSGDEGAWNSAYNWLDFSGVYSDAGQGVLVKDAGTAFDTSSELVIGEVLGSGDGTRTSFAGAFANFGIVPGSILLSAGPINFIDNGTGGLASPDGWGFVESFDGGSAVAGQTSFSGVVPNHPVVAGTVTIVVGGTTFQDDGSGTLTPNNAAGLSGTFAYETGAWSIKMAAAPAAGTTVWVTYQFSSVSMSGSVIYTSGAYAINLQGLALAATDTITVSYRYSRNVSASDISGSTGNPIYTITLLQTGEKLRIIDSNGNVYDGRLYDVNSTAGDLTEVPSSDVTADTGDSGLQGEIVASFYAEGAAYGQWVTMDGTFVGNLISTTENTMFNRHMNGTWRESGGKVGVFFGSAASDAVPLPLITSNAVVSVGG
ncbi:MAG: hypothetical protein HQ523_02955 [Lentisphaerae bacterium]|nr:hypothetical protein [Lentisphaerota bacterium]